MRQRRGFPKGVRPQQAKMQRSIRLKIKVRPKTGPWKSHEDFSTCISNYLYMFIFIYIYCFTVTSRTCTERCVLGANELHPQAVHRRLDSQRVEDMPVNASGGRQRHEDVDVQDVGKQQNQCLLGCWSSLSCYSMPRRYVEDLGAPRLVLLWHLQKAAVPSGRLANGGVILPLRPSHSILPRAQSCHALIRLVGALPQA